MIEHPRAEMHKSAKQLMAKDNFVDATLLLKEAINNFGPHVLALIDLASCYYMLNDFQKFKEFALLSQEELTLHQTRITKTTLKRAVLGLGKILEEIGHVTEAFTLYRTCLHETSDPWVDKIQAHYLRLLSEMNLHNDVAVQYIQCEQLAARDKDREIDLQNALMEADFILFGFKTAKERLKNLVSSPELRDSDRRFLFFNFLYYSLRENLSSQIELSNFDMFNYFQCDHFERALWDLYLTDTAQKTFFALDIKRSEEMSLMSGIRYLNLLSQRSQLSLDILQVNKKLFLYLQTLKRESKQLILKNCGIGHNSEEQVILINKENLLYQGKELHLGKSDNYRSILQLFLGRQAIPIEQVAEKIFGMTWDTYVFDRLRLLITRLNKKLETQVGRNSILTISKSEVRLHSSFRVESAS